MRTKTIFWQAIAVLILFLGIAATSDAAIRYVKPVSSGTGDGSSWANASDDLQAMINTSVANDEIWVAAGTYNPIRPANDITVVDSANRRNSFVVKPDVKMYGGFLGTESNLSQRNLKQNKTILSGDIGTPGVATDNCYHVMIAVGVSQNFTGSVLDGFYIQDGYAKGNLSMYVAIPRTTPGLTQYSVLDSNGGGIYIRDLRMNIANCVFINNYSDWAGGAVNVRKTPYTINNTLFYNNSALYYGGALSDETQTNENIDYSCSITNCTFYNNTITNEYGEGTAMYFNNNQVSIYIASVIATDDNASTKGRIYIFGGESFTQIAYSLIKNVAASGTKLEGTNLVNTNVFKSITSTDPLFLRLKTGSPAVDVGDPNANMPSSTSIGDKDLVSNTRIVNNQVDLGAYELQPLPAAPTAASPQVISTGYTIADLVVTIADDNVAKWYDAATGGNLLPTTTLLQNNTDYYVAQENATGESPRTLIRAKIPQIIYVIPTGTGDGSSWADASGDLQAMINAASAGDEIWVAAGKYIPVRPANNLGVVDEGNRNNAFVLKKDIKIYGGFVGTETVRADRNWKTNVSTLSGHLSGSSNYNTNSYHVVVSADDVGSAVLDGFKIENFSYVQTSGNITVNNRAIDVKNGAGICLVASSPVISNCSFIVSRNSSGLGGAVYAESSSPEINNCIFYETYAYHGGAIYSVNQSQVVVKNSLFYRLMSYDAAGGSAFHVMDNSSITTINCTVTKGDSQNRSNNLVYLDNSSHLNIYNSIFIGNYVSFIPSSNYTIRNSLIQGLANTNNGNIDATDISTSDVFVDYNNNDFRLLSYSPVINLGDNLQYTNAGGSISADKDLAGNPRLYGATIDLGVYEYQCIAMSKPTVTVTEFTYEAGETPTELQATADSGYELRWYDGNDNLLSGAPTPNTIGQNDTTYYYVSNYDAGSGCESTRIRITVIVKPLIPASGLPYQIYTGDNKTLGDLIITGNNIKWYDTSNNELPLNTLLTNNSTYVARQSANRPEGLVVSRIPFEVNVRRVGDNTQNFCGGTPEVDDLLIENVLGLGTPQWFETSSSNKPLDKTAQLSSGDYFLEIVFNDYLGPQKWTSFENNIANISINPQGNNTYIGLDGGGIQKIDAFGEVSIFVNDGITYNSVFGFDAAGNVYAGSSSQGTVVKFDALGNKLKEWTDFYYPYTVLVDSEGMIYVLDDEKISLINPSNDEINSLWSQNQNGFYAYDMSMDADGNIYLALSDHSNHLIQKLNPADMNTPLQTWTLEMDPYFMRRDVSGVFIYLNAGEQLLYKLDTSTGILEKQSDNFSYFNFIVNSSNDFIAHNNGDKELLRIFGDTNRVPVSVVVGSVPDVPSAISSQVHSTGATVANLQATIDAGHTLKWYDVQTGGTELANSAALEDGKTYYGSQTNPDGCESARTPVTVTISPTTGMDQLANSVLTVSPNPVVNEHIIVKGLSGAQNIEILDISGRSIKTCPVSEDKMILNISQLSEGIYLLRTENGKQVKFVVK